MSVTATELRGAIDEFMAGKPWAEFPPRLQGPMFRASIRRVHERHTREGGPLIYAIQQGSDGPIKIGITLNPAERLKTLQQGNPHPLRGIAAWKGFRAMERDMHSTFAADRLHGEWFAPTPDLVETVLAMGGEFEDWA